MEIDLKQLADSLARAGEHIVLSALEGAAQAAQNELEKVKTAAKLAKQILTPPKE